MASGPQRDALSLISNVSSTVFAGRLPKNVDLSELYMLASAPNAMTKLNVVRIVPSRATYLFIEYENPSHAATASEALNGYSLNGARIVVMPATQLRRLFIGNIARDCPASVVHDAIASLEEVR
jgi:RNA recognition motif-containing protein